MQNQRSVDKGFEDRAGVKIFIGRTFIMAICLCYMVARGLGSNPFSDAKMEVPSLVQDLSRD